MLFDSNSIGNQKTNKISRMVFRRVSRLNVSRGELFLPPAMAAEKEAR